MEFILSFVSWVLVALFLAAPIGLGAYMLLFSRRFSLAMYRYRKAAWKIDFTEFDVKVGRVFAAVIGAVLLIVGTIVAVQLLF